jgi:hypothetical protein
MFPQTVALTLLLFLCAILMVLATIDACYGIIPDWANAGNKSTIMNMMSAAKTAW